MSEEPDYILDIHGLDGQDSGGEGGGSPSIAPAGPAIGGGSPSSNSGSAPNEASGQTEGRPWIGVRFECCGVYTRIYRNAEGTAYVGNCPRCTRHLRVAVGPGGTNHRMFRAQ